MSYPHTATAVPRFEGMADAETVVFLVPRFPAWYAPALGTEMRLLRAAGIDVRVLALDSAGERRGVLARSAAAVQRIVLYARAHLRTFRDRPSSYAQGARVARRCAQMRPQGSCAWVRWLWYFLRAVEIGDRLSRSGVTRCHAHFTTNIALLVSEMFPIETSITLHGPTDFANISPALLRAKVEGSAFTRTVSLDGLRRVMDACGRDDHDRIVYVPLGVDLSHFAARPSAGGGRVVRIVCVARLEPVKGHAVLIDAFARAVSLGRRVELLLIGDGRLRSALCARIRALGLEHLVACTGVIENEELPSILAAADLFVLPSHAEGLPVALMEAMATGLPCIATTVNGVPELVLHERTGLLVPPGDVHALTHALTTLIDAPLLRARFGEMGHREVTANHDAVVNAGRMAAALMGAVDVGTAAASRAAPHLAKQTGERTPASTAA